MDLKTDLGAHELHGKIIILNEELEDFDNLRSGFSLHIEILNKKILFDASVGEEAKNNLKKINISPEDLDLIILSHGHVDHTQGLASFNFKSKKKLLCHPDALKPKFYGEMNIGINQEKIKIKERFDLITRDKPFWIIPDKMVFLGEIPRNKAVDPEMFPGKKINGEKDFCLDDTALAIKTNQGLIIVTGCAHSYIENIIDYAKEICNDKRIFNVIGGLHAISVNRTNEILEYFKNNKIKNVCFMHCLCDYSMTKFKERGYKKVRTLEIINLPN